MSGVRDIPEHLQAQATIFAPMKTHGSNGFSTSRGGIHSNVGLIDLRPEYVREQKLFEENLQATEEVFRDASDFLGIGKGLPSVVGKNHQLTYEQLVEKHVKRGEPIQPIMYDDEEDRWILGDEYKAAWAAGKICQHCVGWQEIAHHHICNTIHGGSCGMENPFAAELVGNVRHDLNA